jgi:ParB/RepB/Spo0J family partition protein
LIAWKEQNMEQLVKVELVKDNPYQGRTTYKDIESLGRSIAAEDIQEKPKARALSFLKGTKERTYELKFGHRRLRAFLWLMDNFKALGLTDRYEGYKVMPLDIEELTDEEMNRGVIVENAQREDLTVIEEARMMRDYGTRWNKTSEQIGEVFGKSGATVRGIIRLLELPEAVQDKIASGEISQGAARKLLTIARVDESQIKSAVKNFAAGESAEDVIENAMRNSESAFIMHNSWDRDEKPRAGWGLWDLETKADKFPTQHLPSLTAADVVKALDLEMSPDLRLKIDDYIECMDRSPEFVSQFAESNKNTDNEELMERIAQLMRPPSCAGCVFHAVASRTHYCGFKGCHSRKRAAWVQSKMEGISKKLKIAIYDPAKDGRTILALQESTYNDDGKKHAKLVADNDPDLRLQPHKSDYREHRWTDSRLCRVILVGAKVTASKQKKAEASTSHQAEEEKRRQQNQIEHARNEASHKFLKDYAVKLFGVAFKGLENVPAMCALARVNAPKKDAKKADALSALHAELARDALNNLNGLDWQLYRSGPVALAKFLVKVAPTWDVKLPANLMEVAKGYEPVAAETEEPKKKSKK